MLDEPLTAGGSRADGLFVEGLAPGALRLVPVAAGVVLEVRVQGVRVAGRQIPPGSRRLLRQGEAAELPRVTLALAGKPPGADQTRCAAAALLRGAAAGEPVASARLVVLTGPSAGACHALAAEATLGRGAAATIRVPDPRASRLHARLRVGAAGVTVEDLGSKNGVRLGRVRIDPGRSFAVAPSEELGIGDTLLALEVAHGAGAAPAPLARATARRVRLPSGALRLATAALLALSAAALALAGS